MSFGKFSTSFLIFLFCIPAVIQAQAPVKPNAADIHQAIKKLNVLGSVLYVAAHPDDENQRLISYCANEKLYDVTYLSLTRGDGGQNLIGSEFGELLGVLRTQELLMARSIDGGRQQFSRANDFGFSKSPEETLNFWNKDEVLADVVWTIRQTRPDVIVNRFYHDKKYDTHGHHTASAMLSVEAFDLAGKPEVYPKQLKYTEPWQPNRQFFNTSWFFYGSQEAFAKTDKTNLYSVDIGVYLPLKGKSNNEVASEARSMHRCQGFGGLTSRGESPEWLDFIKGQRPATKDPFEGLNTTWSRVPGGEPVGKILAEIDNEYRLDKPGNSIPKLIAARKMIQGLSDSFWKRKKLAEIDQVIKSCLGLYLEASTSVESASPGDSVKVRLEGIFRTDGNVTLNSVAIAPSLFDTTVNKVLERNKNWILERKVKIPDNSPFTAPYWLQQPHTVGMYTVSEQELYGKPETPRFLKARWSFGIAGETFEFESEIAMKKGEPDFGEVWQPFEILPPVFVEFSEASYIFNQKVRNIDLKVRSGRNLVEGQVRIEAPSGWKVTPLEGRGQFAFQSKGEEKTVTFRVEAPEKASEVDLLAFVEIGGKSFGMKLSNVAYSHIPRQAVLLPARARAVRADIRLDARQIGYYMGAGDNIPAALRQLGAQVTLLDDASMNLDNLKRFDAVVVGVRAFNTRDNLKFHQSALMQYANQGGTLLVQYNNSFDLVAQVFGASCEGCPVLTDGILAASPIKISRTRVTDEEAEVRFLIPGHIALTKPNQLAAADFTGWVQERGLYFPSEWPSSFQAPLSMNDPGEKPADGALLVAPYGKGYIAYTALSFFRQLPAGVPGAYRLFANLLSL